MDRILESEDKLSRERTKSFWNIYLLHLFSIKISTESFVNYQDTGLLDKNQKKIVQFSICTKMETKDISMFAKRISFYHFIFSEWNRWLLWECLTKCRDSTCASYLMFIQSHCQFWVTAASSASHCITSPGARFVFRFLFCGYWTNRHSSTRILVFFVLK